MAILAAMLPGLQRAFVTAAQQHHVRHAGSRGVGIVGDQHDLCAAGLCGPEHILRIPGGAGVGNKQNHVVFLQQAGGHDLHVVVFNGKEFWGHGEKTAPGLPHGGHTAAVAQAENFAGPGQKIARLDQRWPRPEAAESGSRA